MYQMFLKKSIFLLLIILLIGCRKSTKQKISDFIKEYNAYTFNADYRYPNLISTYAELATETKIRIVSKVRVEKRDIDRINSMEKKAPMIWSKALSKDKELVKLMDDGVIFELVFLAEDGTELLNTDIDLLTFYTFYEPPASDRKPSNKRLNYAFQEVPVNDESLSEAPKPKTPMEVEIDKTLKELNKNLPYIDPKSGNKVLNIEFSDKNELVYEVITYEDLKTIVMKGEDNIEFKTRIIQDKELKTLLKRVKRYGITKIKFVYFNSVGDRLTQIIINEDEMKL